MADAKITPDLIRQLAHVAQLDIPDDNVEVLAMALEGTIDDVRRAPLKDMPEAYPHIGFDPRWE